MAGLGSRFTSAGYANPKPLIEIHGIPMIRWVIRNITPDVKHRFIFIAQAEHVLKYNLAEKLASWSSGSIIIPVDGVTSGAAATVLKAKQYINNESPLVIANSDQWIDANFEDFLWFISQEEIDGSIMTMEADDPKWSFVEMSGSGHVVRVVEKEVISNHATVGIYGFSRGSDFIKFAEQMISENFTVNGEHYVAPVYNWMVRSNKKILTHLIGREKNGMFGLGIPDDLKIFEAHPISRGVWDK